MADKQIHELTAITRSPVNADVLALDTGSMTGKMAYSTFKTAVNADTIAAVDALSDVVVHVDAEQVLTDAQKAMARENIGAADEDDLAALENTVNVGLAGKVDVAQGASNSGKTLVIGANGNVTIGGSVRYDTSQGLTSAQKEVARENIGAVDDDDLTEFENTVNVALEGKADAASTEAALAGKVNVAQGSAQAGKALVIGDDGNVTTGEAGIPDAVKTALLEIFKHVAYVDASGQTWYEALEEALRVDDDFYNIYHRSLSEGLLSKLVGGANTDQNDTSMYPSRINITEQTNRRSIGVTKGKAPYYRYGLTALSSGLYPIPVPASANHVRIAITPINQYVYCHFVQYDTSTNQYSNTMYENRITWTQIGNEGLEKDITNPGNMFMVINMKYDNAGSTYPVEPQDITIEFSEVN